MTQPAIALLSTPSIETDSVGDAYLTVVLTCSVCSHSPRFPITLAGWQTIKCKSCHTELAHPSSLSLTTDVEIEVTIDHRPPSQDPSRFHAIVSGRLLDATIQHGLKSISATPVAIPHYPLWGHIRHGDHACVTIIRWSPVDEARSAAAATVEAALDSEIRPAGWIGIDDWIRHG